MAHQLGGDVDGGQRVGDGCHDVLSPERDVDVAVRAEPHVAIDAAAGIPAGVGLLGIVDAHGYDVVAVTVEPRGEVIAERSVAVGACAEFVSVDVDGRVHVGTVKINHQIVTFLDIVKRERLAIPSHAARECSAAGAGGV